jgi:hypothetical protein
MLIVCCGMLSCSPHDSDVDRRAREFAAEHPHPFELTATDSSIIGRYVWEDTLREYSMGACTPNEDGILQLGNARGSFVPAGLVRGGVCEWPFDALGLERLTDGCTIHFGRSGPETEFGYAWKYEGGEFDPIFIR